VVTHHVEKLPLAQPHVHRVLFALNQTTVLVAAGKIVHEAVGLGQPSPHHPMYVGVLFHHATILVQHVIVLEII
jgi:hypothetical protein